MSRLRFHSVCATFLLLALLVPAPILAASPSSLVIVADFDAVLEPGVWHSWPIRASSACGGYVVEVSPLSASITDAYVEEAQVRPEYDGVTWTDVLRVRIPADQPALNVNLRVYSSCRLPVVSEFEAVLLSGEWMGWVIGPSSIDRGYVVEVTPLEPSAPGAYVWKAGEQEEFFMGEWQDVLRAQIPGDQPNLRVHFRVFATDRLPVVAEAEIGVEPGVLGCMRLGPSAQKGGYLIEINPRGVPVAGEFAEYRTIRAMLREGESWSDWACLRSPAEQPPFNLQLRVYGRPR